MRIKRLFANLAAVTLTVALAPGTVNITAYNKKGREVGRWVVTVE